MSTLTRNLALLYLIMVVCEVSAHVFFGELPTPMEYLFIALGAHFVFSVVYAFAYIPYNNFLSLVPGFLGFISATVLPLMLPHELVLLILCLWFAGTLVRIQKKGDIVFRGCRYFTGSHFYFEFWLLESTRLKTLPQFLPITTSVVSATTDYILQATCRCETILLYRTGDTPEALVHRAKETLLGLLRFSHEDCDKNHASIEKIFAALSMTTAFTSPKLTITKKE